MMEQIDDGVIVALCTPLMKRVHSLIKNSGEMMFMDAGGCMDRLNYRVFLLLTHSPAGGLPIGVLITPNEQCQTISRALLLYQSMLDDSAFFGRGAQGPVVIMTDDCASLRQALSGSYPGAKLLLCIFHMLQAHWRYLWAADSKVLKNYRQHLFHILKGMVYAESEGELEKQFEAAMTDPTTCNHPRVKGHLADLYDRRSEWALCCRSDLPVRNNNTNNYCEAAMRVMKDSVLHRSKAFNVQQLLAFIITRLDSHYQRRLLDVANNRLDNVCHSRFVPKQRRIAASEIAKLSDSTYKIASQSKPGVQYVVDMAVGVCSCHVGYTGGPCKHQSAIAMTLKVSSWNMLPVNNAEMRQLLCTVAVGSRQVPTSQWFQPLRPDPGCLQGQGESLPTATSASLEIQVVGTQTMATESGRDVSQPDVPDENLLSCIQASFNKITDMYKQAPGSLGPSIQAFCRQTEQITTISGMQSALMTFGKYSGAGVRMTSGKRIGVQPTAIARRKTAVGGRRRLHVGRIPHSSWAPEHGYCQTRVGRHAMPKRRAPHSLANAVATLGAVARTHSAK